MAGSKAKVISKPGKQEFFVEREFDAPRELVFRAFTDPELYSRWIGGHQWEAKVEKMEGRNGGSWRMTQKDDKGEISGFHGVYHEINPPERMIGTFEYEQLPEPGHVSLETATFEELPGGRTKMRSQSVFRSVEDRDGMIQSGMEDGMNDTYSRLDELLEELKVTLKTR